MDEDDRRKVGPGSGGDVERIETETADIGQFTDIRCLCRDGAGAQLRGDREGCQQTYEDKEDDEQGETDTG